MERVASGSVSADGLVDSVVFPKARKNTILRFLLLLPHTGIITSLFPTFQMRKPRLFVVSNWPKAIQLRVVEVGFEPRSLSPDSTLATLDFCQWTGSGLRRSN